MSSVDFVTGAAGFAGRHLVRRLVAEGHGVRVLVRQPAQERALRDQGLHTVRGDLRYMGDLVQALAGIDVVYHLAADFRSGRASTQQLSDTNVAGTRKLVEAAARAGVKRFVHCSSVGVHGEIRHPPANEDSPFNPGDAYQESKLYGERAAREAAAQGNVPLVVFRPAGIYGPGDQRFLKLVKAVQAPVFPMLGWGRVLYQMIYIDDLIDGVLRCGESPRAVGNTYILTGSRSITLNQLVTVVAGALGKKPRRVYLPVTPVYLASALVELVCAPFGIEPPLFRRRLDVFRKDRSFDISKARRELGFDPRTTLEEGFRRTVDWYRSKGLIR